MRSGAEELPVAGIGPLSTLDYPGHLALTVFAQGCPWRCPYCHNAALRPPAGSAVRRWAEVRGMLAERRGFLEAVVFSGGEPTLHSGLAGALRETRALGYRNGLHTAGMVPERLREILPLLDWIGLDIKAPFDERYARLTGDLDAAAKVATSLARIQASAVPFQLRMTVADGPEGDRLHEEVRWHLLRSGYPKLVRQSIRIPKSTAPIEEVS